MSLSEFATYGIMFLVSGCSTIEYGGLRRTAVGVDLSFEKLHFHEVRPDGSEKTITVTGAQSEQTKALEAVARGAAAGAVQSTGAGAIPR